MIAALKIIVDHRELIGNFAAREIKAKYKQALLGFSWTILQPLFQLMILTLVFSYFARVPSEGFPYPLYMFCGLLPWLYFSSGVNRGTVALINQRALITKIYFPRESLVYAALIAATVDFFFASLVYVGLLMYYGITPTMLWLLAIPVLIIQVILMLGIMLLLAPMNAIYRDVGQAIPLLLQFWMYLSPILYPVTLVPDHIRYFYYLNPMAGIIDSYRDVLLRQQLPSLNHLIYALVTGSLALVLGYLYFKRAEGHIADVA